MTKGWSSFMDRRVKERLIGATILVVFIVLIVPELLSGPKRPANPQSPLPTSPTDPVRNVTVDLATSKATSAAEAPASSTASTPAAAPFPATPGEVTHEAPAAPATPSGSDSDDSDTTAGQRPAAPPTITTLQAQQPVTPALENDALPPKSPGVAPKPGIQREVAGGPHRNWAVQLGSFASSANAEQLQRRLRKESFSAYISSSGAGKALRYRVRVGPLTDRAAADRMIAKLRNEGHPASVVVP
jgi:DedD protein